ncbi:MAG: adenylate/guanylate cyclase domain-containing protein, partial [Methanocorpusculum sp.]|nr:adenylate/guanylate cyclase domain-containing protein [Methanocorpusculum sp.]
ERGNSVDKSTGSHFYIGVPNFGEIIKGEETAYDEVKRSIHRLHTYYAGIITVANHYGAEIEKFSGGRAHVYIEQKDQETDDDYILRCLKCMIASFRFVYDVFNNLGKYSLYTKFTANGGADYGDFYKYEIVDMNEFTTIGGVANIAAKLAAAAQKKYLYVTDSLYNLITTDLKDDFELLDEQELKEIQERLKGNPRVYRGLYSDLFNDDEDMEQLLDEVSAECNNIANSFNLSDMQVEKAYAKIAFSNLSRKKSKQISAGILYADIRGFTKLFNVSGNNLDDLALVLKDIYDDLNQASAEYGGVRVQFQGDRIVAVFNTFTQENDLHLVRMFRAALLIKKKLNDLNGKHKERLSGKKLKVGIGLCYGQFYATRLGKKTHTDNQVMGKTTDQGDIAEDRYAGDQEIVANKSFKEEAQAHSEESIACSVIINELKAISTTGYYHTSITLDEFDNAIEKATKEAIEQSATKKMAAALTSSKEIITPYGSERVLRPWRG